ncbi:hypothetical protein QHH03_30320, partial [Aphanizomenon sp. 202]|nr:hypothetical protein [Aphanizomenon sp. 202]
CTGWLFINCLLDGNIFLSSLVLEPNWVATARLSLKSHYMVGWVVERKRIPAGHCVNAEQWNKTQDYQGFCWVLRFLRSASLSLKPAYISLTDKYWIGSQ